MRVIQKHTLKVVPHQILDLPLDAQILSVLGEVDKVGLWALVDTEAETFGRSIMFIGTARPITYMTGQLGFIGTVKLDPFVWHIFEETEDI